MINYKGNNIGQVFHRSKVVSQIYHYAKVVWQAIRSCFGMGVWYSDRPWLGDDKWKNNV